MSSSAAISEDRRRISSSRDDVEGARAPRCASRSLSTAGKWPSWRAASASSRRHVREIQRGRIEEDRLGAQIGFRRRCLRSSSSRTSKQRAVCGSGCAQPLTTTSLSSRSGAPSVELEADEPAQRMADESGAGRRRAPSISASTSSAMSSTVTSVRQRRGRCGRCRDGRRGGRDSARSARRGWAPSKRPSRRGPARGSGPSPSSGPCHSYQSPAACGHQPICATQAISTSRPGFTSPHWMQ